MRICYIFRNPNTIFCSIEKTFSIIANQLEGDSVEVVCLPEANASLWSVLKNFLWCMNLSRKEHFDIFHVVGPDNYIAMALPHKKVVLSIHDLGMIYNNRGIKKEIARWFWYKFPAYHCAYLTVNSSKTLNELSKEIEISSLRTSIINPPIADIYKYCKKEFCVDKPKILQVGTLERKNIELVIKAIAGLHCEYRIIGTLSETQIDLLKENNIEYSNDSGISEQQLFDEYIKCDIVTFVSKYEGFGVPIIESQAVGRPVITSNIEPMKSVAGEGACLVNPTDADELRAAIYKLIYDEQYRNQVVEKGIKNSERYRSAIIAKQYQDVYETVNSSFG